MSKVHTSGLQRRLKKLGCLKTLPIYLFIVTGNHFELTSAVFVYDVGIAEKVKQQVHVAYKGLSQLHQFDNRNAPSFSVSLEQNPFPKPDNYADNRTRAVDKVLKDNEEKK